MKKKHSLNHNPMLSHWKFLFCAVFNVSVANTTWVTTVWAPVSQVPDAQQRHQDSLPGDSDLTQAPGSGILIAEMHTRKNWALAKHNVSSLPVSLSGTSANRISA